MKEIVRKFAIAFIIAIVSCSLASAQMPPEPPVSGHHGMHGESPYRGRRMMNQTDRQNSVFFAERIAVKRNHGLTAIIIFFNMPFDPLSVKKENISIDGKPLERASELKFARMGNMMQILVPDSGEKIPEFFDLRLDSIVSFNGLPLEKPLFKKIHTDKPYLCTE